MDSRLALAARAYNLNTRLVENCLQGVDDETANRRASDRTNSIAFLALHLTDARHWIIGWLGGRSDNPFHDLLKDAKGIDDVAEFPPVEQILDVWRDTARALLDCLLQLSHEKLAESAEPAFPLGDQTVMGGIAFLSQHEAYHIGQMAYVRKWLGLGGLIDG